MSTTYGTAIMQRDADGTVTVLQADPVIGMTRDLWDTLEYPHKREDGTLWLDSAGTHRYRFVEEQLSWAGPEMDIVVFEAIEYFFDDASVTNPATGKPYGPGPLWAGTEPMDYPDPRCICSAYWDENGCTANAAHQPPTGEQA